ncbi:DUF1877 family protein [uncultured Arcticibacterium sp.]|uniref:DUF1877 family protein n=1 Tax=uncultured Arcticibacterium sp. TaxID=2173042 RepID=UPI0030F69438
MVTEFRFHKIAKTELKTYLTEPSKVLDISADFSLDETWHAIHFLLCKVDRDGELKYAEVVLEGIELPMPETMMEMYEPTFNLGSPIHDLNVHLSKVNEKELVELYLESELEENDIHIPIYFEEMEEDEQKSMLLRDIIDLKKFYSEIEPEREFIIKYLGC